MLGEAGDCRVGNGQLCPDLKPPGPKKHERWIPRFVRALAGEGR